MADLTWGEYISNLESATKVIKEKYPAELEVGIIISAHLDKLVEAVKDPVRIPFEELPGMPNPSAHWGAGALIAGELNGKKVLILSGRSHLYEGYHPHQVQYGARLLALAGCKIVLISATVGSSDPSHRIGQFVAIREHINHTHIGFATKPLTQTAMYDLSTASLLTSASGVYSFVIGPSYETPAEAKALAKFGVTLYGMSAVPEVIALKELGVPVAAFGLVVNRVCGSGCAEPVTQEAIISVLESVGSQAAAELAGLVGAMTVPKCCKPVELKHPFPAGRIIPPALVPLDVEATQQSIEKLLAGVKISTITVLAPGHKAAAVPGLKILKTIPLTLLDRFPLCQHIHAQLQVGAFCGTTQLHAFVDGLCPGGLSVAALAYLINGFKHLGVTDYVQTFATCGCSGCGPAILSDINNWFEPGVMLRTHGAQIVNPAVAPGVKRITLATYHGPECPTKAELKLLCGACDEVAIGTGTGLIYGQAQGLKVVGISDGGDVGGALELVRAAIFDGGPAGAPPEITLGAGGQAFTWNEIPPISVHVQEAPADVDAMAAKLPDAAALILFNTRFPPLFRKLTEGLTAVDLGLPELHAVFEKQLKDKKVLLSSNNHLVVRAAVKKGLKIIGLSSVFALAGDVLTGELVSIVDHINLFGLSALVGENKSGSRFLSAAGCYRTIPGLRQVTSVVMPIMLAEAGAKRVAKNLGGQVYTAFGPQEAVLIKHAGGDFAHVGYVVHGEWAPWFVCEEKLYELVG